MTEITKLSDIVSTLEFIGEALSGGDYVSASEMTSYGKTLLDIAEELKEIRDND